MAAVLKTSIQRLLTLLVGMVVLTDATDAVELLSWIVPVVEVGQQGDYPGSRQLLPRALDDSSISDVRMRLLQYRTFNTRHWHSIVR